MRVEVRISMTPWVPCGEAHSGLSPEQVVRSVDVSGLEC